MSIKHHQQHLTLSAKQATLLCAYQDEPNIFCQGHQDLLTPITLL